MLATSATPCAKVARGQTGLQKAEGQLTYHYFGIKPLITPLQIQAEFLDFFIDETIAVFFKNEAIDSYY